MATIAVFVALGGSSYAAITITGRDVKNGSLTGKDVHNNSLTGRDIKEAQLATVPRARRLGGFTAGQLQQRCPTGTVHRVGACVERTARSAVPYSTAINTCQTEAFKGFADGAGRLPTWQELYRAVNGGATLTAPGELTADVADVRPDGIPMAIAMTDAGGRSELVPDTTEGPRPFRCALDPVNDDVTDPQG
jgi:hypothetical protein